MQNLPILIALIPTLLMLVLIRAFAFWRLQTLAIWIAILLGMLVTIPVMTLEGWVEGPAATDSDFYQKAFVQQVLGAAVVEELAIFSMFLLVYLLFRRSTITKPTDIVALAVAVAVGFLTVENLLAVLAQDDPFTEALSRLTTIFAGHPTLQLVMGYFAAQAFLGRRNRLLSAMLMIALPILIHGWGDFSEAVFQAFNSVDPDGSAAGNWFSAWIVALAIYLMSAIAVLWQIRSAWTKPDAWADTTPAPL